MLAVEYESLCVATGLLERRVLKLVLGSRPTCLDSADTASATVIGTIPLLTRNVVRSLSIS